ncbi:MAG TPA: GTP cyclohydrolase [Bacteroidetes bacterium]|nr:GTP cyclohydrolase [Bacteroidota bacterium]
MENESSNNENSIQKTIPTSVNKKTMTIQEFEVAYYAQDIEEYPKFNQLGYELFDSNENRALSDFEKQQMIMELEKKISDVLDILRISRKDPNSSHTSLRISKMLVNELLAGRYNEAPKITVFPNRKHVNNLIISQGIEIMSICSHHWQTISGKCVVGYIPGDYVVGISKLSRIVEWFARRPQIQEEMGEQIADYIQRILKPKALGVVIKAKHYCMISRGVEESEEDSEMITSVMRGLMLNDINLRNEFLNLIKDF